MLSLVEHETSSNSLKVRSGGLISIQPICHIDGIPENVCFNKLFLFLDDKNMSMVLI